MLTSSQIRAARALTGISKDALCAASGLSSVEFDNAEAHDALPDPTISERLRAFFETRGVIFLAAGDGGSGMGPGVRLKQDGQEEGMRPEDLNAANDD